MRPSPPLGQRIRQAIADADQAGIDITHHKHAIERRLDAMTRKIAARDAPPS